MTVRCNAVRADMRTCMHYMLFGVGLDLNLVSDYITSRHIMSCKQRHRRRRRCRGRPKHRQMWMWRLAWRHAHTHACPESHTRAQAMARGIDVQRHNCIYMHIALRPGRGKCVWLVRHLRMSSMQVPYEMDLTRPRTANV